MQCDQAVQSPYAQAPERVAEAFVAGREASACNKPMSACPYSAGTDEHGAWHRGYRLKQILSSGLH
ncbi:ribosome modulation factor [Sphingomonas mucosissima]|uniref:ribosome modulation factor n=1 Tax=Sphingomonas mucosissima TaxID=370959 RepID=UPI003CCB83A4